MNHIQANDFFDIAKNLHQQNKYEESNKYLNEILKISQDATIKAMLSLNYLRLGNIDKSLNIALTALSKNNINGFLYYVLGSIYIDKSDFTQSIKYLKVSLSCSPNDIVIINSLSFCYGKLNNKELHKKYLKKSLSIDNKQIEIIKTLAFIKGNELNYKKSIRYYRYLLSIDSSSKASSIYHLLALAYHNAQEYHKAIHYFTKSLETFSKTNAQLSQACYDNLATSFYSLKLYDNAKKAYMYLLSLNPSHAKGHWGLSILYLLQGDFKNGWRKYEWRKKLDNYEKRTHGLLKNTPIYKGENLENKTLSIHSEQGFGDTVQFSRFVLYLLEHTKVKLIVFRIHTELYELFKNFNSTRCRLYPEGFRYVTKVRADYQMPLMSIPSFINFDFQSFYSKPYLLATKPFLLPLNKAKLNIGIAWSRSSEDRSNDERSIDLRLFEDILLDKRIQIYSLQMQEINEDISKYNYEDKIISLDLQIKNFEDTVSIMSKLDLIISIDTVIAHLAGALGLKTFLLLQYSSDFRWFLDRKDTPWYENMKLFRQEKLNDFTKPIKDIEFEIEDILREEKTSLNENYTKNGLA